jgi:serine/threonine-protein kinase
MVWAWETSDARLARDRSASNGAPQLAEKSIAVLPFADMSPNGDHEYLGDGIAEEISTRLAQIEGLRVAARTSAFQFKGTSPDIRRVGEQLGVASVLEGSVRRSGDRVRITAQLIDARNGYHLWGATYEKGIGDVFAIEDTISQAIAATLRVRLTNAAAATLTGHRAVAYDHYLRGRHFLREHTAEGNRLAAEAFHRAIEIDSTLAKAYSGLADMELNPSAAAPGPRFRRALELTERALAMDSTLAQAHASRGWLTMWYDRDWQAAERSLRRARELDPGYTPAFNWTAAHLLATGRLEESLAMIRYSYEQVPSASNASFVAARLLWLGRTDEALEFYRGALALDSTLFLVRWGLGRAYLELERFDEALAEFRRPGLDNMGIYQDGYIGYTLGRAGRNAEAREVLERMHARMGRGEYVAPTDVALVHLGLGERDRALDWIERHEADRGARIFLSTDPLFDPLRREPRFVRLLDRLGLGAAR